MSRSSVDSGTSAALKRVDSFTYPNAHDGHLTPDQQEKLQQFKDVCGEAGYYKPADERNPAGKPATHDDETLLRYLRARKFVPKDAFVQFKDTEDWRKENEIDKLYDTIDVAEYDETRRLYPQWTGRRDKRGIPVYVFEIRNLNSKTMRDYQKALAARPRTTHTNISLNLRNLFALYENLIQFVMPLCSAIPTRPYADTPVSQSNNIVDISGVGLKQFWDLKGHMQEASTLATAHYPETLDRIFIIGAPSFFPTVWSWIKRWFDPITVSKIFILSAAETKDKLAEFIDVENIPKKYGGTLDWGWGSLPIVDPEVSRLVKWADDNTAKDFPIGPIRWRPSKSGAALEAVALGTVDGKQREQVIASLPIPRDAAIQRTASAAHVFTAAGAAAAAAEERAGDDAAKPPHAPLNTGIHADSRELDARAEQHPEHDAEAAAAGRTTVQTKERSVADARDGTSNTRFQAQAGTAADGHVATGTPSTIGNEAGDKTAVHEPRTVGQAPKDVAVPEAESVARGSFDGGGGDTKRASYAGQAYAAAEGVAVGAAGLGGSLLSAVGLGGGKGKEEVAKEKEAEETKRKAAETEKHEKVDGLDTKEVEDFIRSQYATGQGGKAA